MRVVSSELIDEPVVIIDRPTDCVLVFAAGLLHPDVIEILDKLLSTR